MGAGDGGALALHREKRALQHLVRHRASEQHQQVGLPHLAAHAGLLGVDLRVAAVLLAQILVRQ